MGLKSQALERVQMKCDYVCMLFKPVVSSHRPICALSVGSLLDDVNKVFGLPQELLCVILPPTEHTWCC